MFLSQASPKDFLGLILVIFLSSVDFTEEKIVDPDNVNDEVQPNDEISNQHSKPIISKQPYDDHMDSSTEDPESSNFMSYFFVLTIITICGYLIFYNKKKVRNLIQIKIATIRIYEMTCL